MPVSDRARIEAQRAEPALLTLWRTLQPLRGLARFMSSGAHPDDEQSGMLAALAYRDGLSLSYVCATRGEGGQNDIGREAGAALGALRTAEMAQAADVLGLDLRWLGDGPDDPITDFGFSKSGADTLARWGRERTLRRFVEAIRADRPDILCPTFLDIPGQHGHHRAMTELAPVAVRAAADPGFAAAGLPWRVSKLYLPAWSGAGDAYDDDLPPPPETVRVPGAGREAPSGWTWEEIGQHSRAFHATQGMGRWVGPAEGAGWPLHLAWSAVGPDREAVADNLPRRFADLAPDPALAALDAAVAAVPAAWPDTAAVAGTAGEALRALAAARSALGADWAQAHRLDRAERRLARALMLASGVRLTARFATAEMRPGDRVEAELAAHAPHGPVSVTAAWRLPAGWKAEPGAIRVAPDAAPFDAYAMTHAAHGPTGLVAVTVTLRVDGAEARLDLPPETPALVLPAAEGRVAPEAILLNRLAPRPCPVALAQDCALDLPAGWRRSGDVLRPPDDVAPGLFTMPVTRDGLSAQSAVSIDHAHVGRRLLCRPAALRLRVTDVALAPARVGYVGGGADRVDHWLAAMGAAVAPLTDDALPAGLAGLDTVVVGLFAMRTRPALRACLPALHDWVRAGGNLVTLYHRPWDAWSAARTPLARLEIGKPSLRFRVTDETAAVAHLEPDHPLLTTPNTIGPDDWAGWVKERGLYFAMAWDPAYAALLSMADPDEPPHRGALLSGRFGAGRHTHCALILHHQAEHLVPGAFRLLANLIAPAG